MVDIHALVDGAYGTYLKSSMMIQAVDQTSEGNDQPNPRVT
jgi:hypothetical protein